MAEVMARLVKKQTDDGTFQTHDDVPLGKLYRIDPSRMKVCTFYNVKANVLHEKEMVPDLDQAGWMDSEQVWLPVEILEWEGKGAGDGTSVAAG